MAKDRFVIASANGENPFSPTREIEDLDNPFLGAGIITDKTQGQKPESADVGDVVWTLKINDRMDIIMQVIAEKMTGMLISRTNADSYGWGPWGLQTGEIL